MFGHIRGPIDRDDIDQTFKESYSEFEATFPDATKELRATAVLVHFGLEMERPPHAFDESQKNEAEGIIREFEKHSKQTIPPDIECPLVNPSFGPLEGEHPIERYSRVLCMIQSLRRTIQDAQRNNGRFSRTQNISGSTGKGKARFPWMYTRNDTSSNAIAIVVRDLPSFHTSKDVSFEFVDPSAMLNDKLLKHFNCTGFSPHTIKGTQTVPTLDPRNYENSHIWRDKVRTYFKFPRIAVDFVSVTFVCDRQQD